MNVFYNIRQDDMFYIMVLLLDACNYQIFVINQEQAFEGLFKWDFIVDVKAKLNMARIGEKINEVQGRGTRQALIK